MRGPDLKGRLIAGRYEILSFIGEGGYASVWKARQLQPEGFVAVKILHPDHASDTAILQSFLREAQLYVPFRDDPQLVTILESGHDPENGVYFLVMTLLEETVGQLGDRLGPLPLDRVLRLAEDIGSALETIHAAGLVHRDVKGSNIMTAPGKDRFVLTDFGIGFLQGAAEKTVTPTELAKIGSWAYASPERIRARSRDDIRPEADYYALGVVLFRAATGRYPYPPQFPAVIQHHLETPVPDPRAARPDMPAGLAELIARCLQKDPELRLAGVEYRRALERAKVDVARGGGATGKKTELSDAAGGRGNNGGRSSGRSGSGAKKSTGSARGLLRPLLAGGLLLLLVTIAAIWILQRQSVSVDSNPPGARFRVWEGTTVTGEPVAEGTTPGTAKGLGAKIYTAELEKPGFFPARVQWDLTSKPDRVPLVPLEPRLSLRINTTPAGALARLSLAGQESLGERETPCEFGDLRGGEYELAVERTGYRPSIQRLQLSSESRDLEIPLEVETVASLELFTTPVGASVRIDGASVDQSTPCFIGDLEPGRHRFRFSLEGYESAERAVDLVTGMNPALHVNLAPRGTSGESDGAPNAASSEEPGSAYDLAVSVSPGFAYVYVDGSSQALNSDGSVGPWPVKLSPGAHSFRLVNDKSKPKIELTLFHTLRPKRGQRTLVLNWRDKTVTER